MKGRLEPWFHNCGVKARHGPRHMPPNVPQNVKGRKMARKQMKLTVLPAFLTADPEASILAPEVLPAFKGDEDEDLLCGSCGVVLCEGVRAGRMATLFRAPVQLLLKCPNCGVFNYLPSQLGD